MSDPYLPYATPPTIHPGPSWAVGPSVPTRRNGIAITALVLSIIAVLGVLGIVVMWFMTFAAGTMFAGGDFMSDEYTLTGTAAQVVDGEPYAGERLTAEVERVLDNDWSTYEGVECDDTTVVEAGAEASCTGVVDGMDIRMTVEFEDGQGHFTLIQHY